MGSWGGTGVKEHSWQLKGRKFEAAAEKLGALSDSSKSMNFAKYFVTRPQKKKRMLFF